MVHDDRVTRCLARLGGLYRDPVRVDRDASSLCRSSVGKHLVPNIAGLATESNGRRSTSSSSSSPTTTNVLLLQGTIAIHYKGQTYQLLIDMFLPGGYPRSPPVCYVRVVENMYLKRNHKHVGSDGKVYLPYLHEWNTQTHNLVELVVAMSSVFSNEPPVFSKPPSTSTSPTTTSPTAAATAQRSSTTSRSPTRSNNNNNRLSPTRGGGGGGGGTTTTTTNPTSGGLSWLTSMFPSERENDAPPTPEEWKREDEVAREVLEANHAAEAARRAERVEQERQLHISQQREHEKRRLNEIRDKAVQRIQKKIQESMDECQRVVLEDHKTANRLQAASVHKVKRHLDLYKTQIEQYEKQINVVDQSTKDIENWLRDAEERKKKEEEEEEGRGDDDENKREQQQGGGQRADECVQPVSPMHEQMLDLAAENASITDCLYFLDRGLYHGQIDCQSHLKQVRKLAKRQFIVRAHLIKINEVVRSKKNSRNMN